MVEESLGFFFLAEKLRYGGWWVGCVFLWVIRFGWCHRGDIFKFFWPLKLNHAPSLHLLISRVVVSYAKNANAIHVALSLTFFNENIRCYSEE